MGNLSTPRSVQKLQKALHAKAKAEAGYRFYALYDKISREDILAHAYAQCRSNKGAPGVDGQDFAEVERYGLERWLGELALALKEETYRPDPIRRVYIPKANGGTRPLGIPTVADRIAQEVARRYLEPYLEPVFHADSYGYRPGRSAIDAVRQARQRCWRYDWVLDIDVKGYFDSIDWELLLKAVRHHTNCTWVLLYIERWLKAPVQMEDGQRRAAHSENAAGWGHRRSLQTCSCTMRSTRGCRETIRTFRSRGTRTR